MEENNINYESWRKKGTSEFNESSHKLMDYNFGRYVVQIILSENNEFLGINKIEINKQFLNVDTILSVASVDLDDDSE